MTWFLSPSTALCPVAGIVARFGVSLRQMQSTTCREYTLEVSRTLGIYLSYLHRGSVITLRAYLVLIDLGILDLLGRPFYVAI